MTKNDPYYRETSVPWFPPENTCLDPNLKSRRSLKSSEILEVKGVQFSCRTLITPR